MVAETDFLVSPLLEELEKAFETSFKQAWFRILAENSPIDSPRFREVEAFFASRSFYESDPHKIMEIIIALEEIVSLVRQYLLPSLRDRLRISGFYARNNTLGKEHKIKYGFIAYAFPHNINRIESLTGKIRTVL